MGSGGARVSTITAASAALPSGPGRPRCGIKSADSAHVCVRDLDHDGPHRHPLRGEWLNTSPAAAFCPARQATNAGYGSCGRDPSHQGGHIDYVRNIYWQAKS